jgi:hypothetical protein
VAKSLNVVLGETASADKDAPPTWRKSTWSIANGQCIETATLADGRLAVRDSVDKNGPIAKFTGSEWRTFLKAIKDGKFDTI